MPPADSAGAAGALGGLAPVVVVAAVGVLDVQAASASADSAVTHVSASRLRPAVVRNWECMASTFRGVSCEYGRGHPGGVQVLGRKQDAALSVRQELLGQP